MQFGDRQDFLIDLIDQLTSDRNGESRGDFISLFTSLFILGVFFFSSFPFLSFCCLLHWRRKEIMRCCKQ